MCAAYFFIIFILVFKCLICSMLLKSIAMRLFFSIGKVFKFSISGVYGKIGYLVLFLLALNIMSGLFLYFLLLHS